MPLEGSLLPVVGLLGPVGGVGVKSIPTALQLVLGVGLAGLTRRRGLGNAFEGGAPGPGPGETRSGISKGSLCGLGGRVGLPSGDGNGILGGRGPRWVDSTAPRPVGFSWLLLLLLVPSRILPMPAPPPNILGVRSCRGVSLLVVGAQIGEVGNPVPAVRSCGSGVNNGALFRLDIPGMSFLSLRRSGGVWASTAACIELLLARPPEEEIEEETNVIPLPPLPLPGRWL